ncbi:MAG: hypothetical protein CFE28_06425 [Alphaproteobacteria bacterium PA2]|nr:MAG: hypothetical protein CFE28_06425 [Alphaproteobacteria bacterium PA2]
MDEIRVAFAGHSRPEDLGDISGIDAGLTQAFDLVKGLASQGVLLTGLAAGADQRAAKLWTQSGLGRIHAILPHLDEALEPQTVDLAAATTWLDGARIEAEGRNPHLSQTRWLMEDADLLIAVWTGEAGRGAGGTADAVLVALRRGIPVVWVKPGKSAALSLILPDALDDDFGFLEFLEQLKRNRAPLVRPATLETLRAAIGEPPAGPAVLETPSRAWPDNLLDATLWRTFEIYSRIMGGARIKGEPPRPAPESLAAQDGFQALSEAYEAADARAGRLAAVHRSQQVFQAGMMILAAAVGASPAVWPHIKIYAVYTELGLALLTFAVWFTAVRSERSRRWGEARRLAEQLRLERAAWALGISTRDERPSREDGGAVHTAWAWRRQAGSPVGRFDAERVKAWGGWAMDQLVDGQILYHRGHGHLNHRLSHASHLLENLVFWLFVLLLGGFAVAYSVDHAGLPHWLGGVVMLTGAVAPAFGAASLALEAALAFSEQSRRSDRLVQDLSAIARRFSPDSDLERLQQAARAAIRLQVSQEDRWSEDAAHRHQVRAG